ncbi:hypothetical protein DFAR_2470001 [Desulfarculales bacterium]
MMPDKPWKQKSSPFLYAGNWMDTIYYTSAVVTKVNSPTEDTPYPTYEVRWRSETFTAIPTDFAHYHVDDRVTILKDVDTEKKTQLWKDDDMLVDCDKTNWVICPVTFYGLEKEETP